MPVGEDEMVALKVLDAVLWADVAFDTEAERVTDDVPLDEMVVAALLEVIAVVGVVEELQVSWVVVATDE